MRPAMTARTLSSRSDSAFRTDPGREPTAPLPASRPALRVSLRALTRNGGSSGCPRARCPCHATRAMPRRSQRRCFFRTSGFLCHDPRCLRRRRERRRARSRRHAARYERVAGVVGVSARTQGSITGSAGAIVELHRGVIGHAAAGIDPAVSAVDVLGGAKRTQPRTRDRCHGVIGIERSDIDRTASSVRQAVHLVDTHDGNVASPRAEIRGLHGLLAIRSPVIGRRPRRLRGDRLPISPVAENREVQGPYLNRHRNDYFFLTTKILLPCAFWRSAACIR